MRKIKIFINKPNVDDLKVEILTKQVLEAAKEICRWTLDPDDVDGELIEDLAALKIAMRSLEKEISI